MSLMLWYFIRDSYSSSFCSLPVILLPLSLIRSLSSRIVLCSGHLDGRGRGRSRPDARQAGATNAYAHTRRYTHHHALDDARAHAGSPCAPFHPCAHTASAARSGDCSTCLSFCSLSFTIIIGIIMSILYPLYCRPDSMSNAQRQY